MQSIKIVKCNINIIQSHFIVSVLSCYSKMNNRWEKNVLKARFLSVTNELT